MDRTLILVTQEVFRFEKNSGDLGERLKPPVLKTGDRRNTVHPFKSDSLRQIEVL